MNEMYITQLTKTFYEIKPIYESYNIRMKNLLEDLLNTNSIKYHLIESRVKTISSLMGKISKKDGNEFDNIFNTITDLSGVRIILYYQDDVIKVEELIKQEFEVRECENKIEFLQEFEFGYLSNHYIVSNGTNRSILSEWQPFNKFQSEIQVRTVLQHSWAAISHILQYKKEYEVPRELKRRLFRLSGLFELADEEFIRLRDEHNKLNYNLENMDNKKDLLNEPLNSLSLKRYIDTCEIIREIYDKAIVNHFLVCSFEEMDIKENYFYYDEEGLGDLIFLLRLGNYESINDLDIVLNNILPKVSSYFKALNEDRVDDNDLWGAGVDFLIILLLLLIHKDDDVLFKSITKDWGEAIRNRVKNVITSF